MDSSADNIPLEQISFKKKIGTLHGDPVILVATKGGLNLVVTAHGSRVQTLGVGSHRCIAKHVAKKKEPDIEWIDLNKSDFVAEEHFASLLPRYEELTLAFRRAEGSEE